MKMLNIEKLLVNSQWSEKRVLALAKELLAFARLDGKNDFLEVGCGNGVVSRYLADKYKANVVGIDVDKEQIELAEKGIGDVANIRFFEADATRLPFEDASFDLVLSFGVLHHIENWQDALKEIKRALRPGGYFIYADLIYPELITKWDKSSKLSFGLVTVGINELNAFIRRNGFTTLHSLLTKSFVCRNYEAVYRRN
jgi:ubiquinone/menaquinone biosynthesis C-methylase UbiE